MKKKLLGLIAFIIISFNSQSTYTEQQKYESIKNNIYHEKFKDLLLVIHFNHPYYSNIQFLKDLYSPVFKNIVFYGEKPDPNVFDVYSHYGFFLSNVLQDVLTRFPQYKGYLILQDDCILNFWNYLSLDNDKIWFATNFNNLQGISVRNGLSITQFNKEEQTNWWTQIFNGLTRQKTIQLAYPHLAPEDQDVLQKNIGKGNVASNLCDFFYIPRRLSGAALRLSQVFKNVFCEAAIPTMLCCLDSIENWEKLNMIWDGARAGYLFSADYPKKFHWIHPVKFSNLNNRAIITKIFNEILQIQN
jgi:hypothetical protein